MPQKIDTLFRDCVGQARMVLAGRISSLVEFFPYHASVILKDVRGEYLAGVNFSMPKEDQFMSFDFQATTLAGEVLGTGSGLDQWCQFLKEKDWLAHWIKTESD